MIDYVYGALTMCQAYVFYMYNILNPLTRQILLLLSFYR